MESRGFFWNSKGRNICVPADWNYEKWRESVESGKIKQSLKFNAQLFNDYEKQVKSHGGSGNIQPDLVHSSHSGNPRKAEPLQIIDHKNHEGKVDKRAFYDSAGLIYLEIRTTNHGNAKWHTGAHAHNIELVGEKLKQGAQRQLTDDEKKDNGDIL